MLVERVIGHLIPMRFFVFALSGRLAYWSIWPCPKGRVSQVVFRDQSIDRHDRRHHHEFFLNNCLTYHDRPLKGWLRLSTGFVVFMVGCSLGAYANIGVAEMIYHADRH